MLVAVVDGVDLFRMVEELVELVVAAKVELVHLQPMY
jgi:hypothetical protein